MGLAIAAPVGPIGVLVIQRTLRHGVPTGLATGLGAAVADATYGAVGAYGVTGLMAWLHGARVPLALAGGAFLLWLAWRTWFAEPAAMGGSATAAPGCWRLRQRRGPDAVQSGHRAVVHRHFRRARRRAPASPGTMVAGVLAGSALWWLLLCAAVGVLRARFDAAWQRGVARVSALMLVAFALWQWLGLLGH